MYLIQKIMTYKLTDQHSTAHFSNMNMKVVAIAFLIFTHLFCIAQRYSPMPKDSAIWWSMEKHNVAEGGGCTKKFYYMYRNVTFAGFAYKEIIQSDTFFYHSSKIPIPDFNSVTGNNVRIKGYLRNDSAARKVYVRTDLNTNTGENLLYDFNLKVGDTLPHSYIYRHNHAPAVGIPQKLTVSGIDSMLIKGKYHRKYYFSDVNTTLGFVAEGLGGSAGLLTPLQEAFTTTPTLLHRIAKNSWNVSDFEVINAKVNCPTYTPFPEENAFWEHYDNGIPSTGPQIVYKYFYYLSGNTIFEKKNYKNLRINNYSFNQSNREGTCSDYIYTYFRNDSINKRVYIYDVSKIKEVLFYDFNIKINQKLPSCLAYFGNLIIVNNTYIKTYFNTTITGISITGFSNSNKLHRIYSIIPDDLFNYRLESVDLIEGIGIVSKENSTALSPFANLSTFYPENRKESGIRQFDNQNPLPLTSFCSLTGINEISINKNNITLKYWSITSTLSIKSESNIEFLQISDMRGRVEYESYKNQSEIDIKLPNQGIKIIKIISNNKVYHYKIYAE